MRYLSRILTAATAALVLAYPVAAHHNGRAGDHKIKITGCLARTDNLGARARSLVVWSRGDVMFTNAVVEVSPGDESKAVGTSGGPETIFYWLDDEDDLTEHLGRAVELTGEVDDDVVKGEIEIDRKDDFTEIEFDADGKKVTARVPTSWLDRDKDDDKDDDVEYKIVVHKVDVEKVRVTGATCAN